MQSNNRRILQVALGVPIALACFGFLGYSIYTNWAKLASYPWELRYGPLIASFFVYTFDLGLAVIGWHNIMRHFDLGSDLRLNAKIWCMTNPGRRLPGFLWHVVGRVYFYEREGVPISVTSVASGVELVVIIVAGLITALCALPFARDLPLEIGPWPLLVGLLLGLVLVHPRSMTFILVRLRQSPPPGLRYRDTLAWLLIYAVVWAVGGVMLYAVVNAVSTVEVRLLPGLIAAWTLSGVASALATFSPSGLGIREVTLALLLTPYVPTAVGAIIALLMRLVLTVYEVTWGLIATRIPVEVR